jgi:hypothetical protein
MPRDDKIQIFQELLDRGAIQQTHRDTVDELVRRGVLKSPSAGTSRKDTIKAEADQREKRFGGYGLSDQVIDSVSLGSVIPITAAGIAGLKTVGKALTGRQVDPVGDYRMSRDVQDEMMRRSRERTGIPGMIGEFALSLPFAAPGFAGKYGKVAGPAALAAGGNALSHAQRLLLYGRELGGAAKTGAVYGGIYGANSARGGIDEHVGGAAGGAAAGAALGPLMHGGIDALVRAPGAASTVIRRLTGRTPRAIAENNNRLAEFASANVRPYGPAINDGGVGGYAARGLAKTMLGGPLRSGAQGSIDDVLAGTRSAIGEHTGGLPSNDMGAEIKQTLRNNLAERSRSSDEIAGMSSAERDLMIGSIDQHGFAPPPPRVDPIHPRPVSPVRPEPIDPGSVPFGIVQPAPVKRGTVNPQYPTVESMPISQHHIDAIAKAQHEAYLHKRNADDAYAEFSRQAKARGEDPDAALQNWQGTVRNSMQDSELVNAYYTLRKYSGDLASASERVAQARSAASEYQAARWKDATKQAHAKASVDAEAAYIRDQATAARAARDATEAARAKAIRDAEMASSEKAARETARLKAEAIAEAEAATKRAELDALSEYHANRQSEPGFVPGRSRESYPTEFDAAYSQVADRTPEYRSNPMGGPTPEGRAAKTQTKGLVDELATEARERLHLKGPAFDENGEVTAEFGGYLKSRLGSEIGHRITELSKTRPGHAATTPGALKKLRTEIRDAADRAESPAYPELPRTAEAAALRRLHGSLTADMKEFGSRSGGPAPEFTTEGGVGRYVGWRSTKIGNHPRSDMTIFVKPEHLDRLTGSRMPNDHFGSQPATRQMHVDQKSKTISIMRTDKKEIDAATRVPFSTKPEVGLRPVQLWDDGSKVHYGSPVTARSQSPGEHATELMGAVDRGYAEYINEIRAPLRKVFGDKVEPIQAMDMLAKAAETGNLQMLRAYMRVMTEKADPTRGAAAVVGHMMGDARSLKDVVAGFQSIAPEARKVLFASKEGKALESRLAVLVGLGRKLEPYNKAIESAASGQASNNRALHMIGVAPLFWFHFIPTLLSHAGSYGLAKVLASPRYVSWITQAAKVRTPPQMDRHIAKLSFIAGRDSEFGSDIKDAVSNAYKLALTGRNK